MVQFLNRRIALAFAILLTSASLAYAAKPITFVIPFPPGGTADILPRIVAEKLRSTYPAGVVVENKSGAGGNIGADFVARSDPDGTTFLVSPPGPIAINQYLYKSMSFDPTKWVPVTVLATAPNVLDVRSKLPVKNVAEFIAYLKAHPGKVTYASQGNGSTSHLTANLFMKLTGTRMTHIPYRGTAPALAALVSGQVDVFFDNISSSAPYDRSGQLRILAVADEHRSLDLPQVPTFAESHVAGMNAVTFFAVVAPPGTPMAIASSMQKAIAATLALPDVKQKFTAQGAEPRGWSPKQTGQFMRAESSKWEKVINSAHVTLG
ncbi:tripartite tricarboxylate transporter substrate binding protein [Rhodoferax sediminis]|uniref:Tripartite tricarboxylate transporter substrate binding protein n=2 Tax=Rhodoferax sediminis TaxID=2509614 RepID=A0A515DH00_9BURK|nr:tripartite tricarboxylate transporter substrate binding protein [Rhodoferax sediminis]